MRQGVLFRSGHLAHATGEDAAFLTTLGLHTIFDFRNAADQKLEGPDVELPGVRNVNLPLSDPADGAEFWRMVRDGDLDQLRAILSDGKGANRMIASYRMIIRTRTAEHSRGAARARRGQRPRPDALRGGQGPRGSVHRRDAARPGRRARGDRRRLPEVQRQAPPLQGAPQQLRRLGLLPRGHGAAQPPVRRARRVPGGGLRHHRGDLGAASTPISRRGWDSPRRPGSGCASDCSTEDRDRP
ncbi:hypothetical protein SVIOM74S_09013 [Streptomyces violarus]